MWFKAFFLAGTCICAAGCATQVANLPITLRDSQTFNNPYASLASNHNALKAKIAIIPQKASSKQHTRTAINAEELSEYLGSALEASMSKLADFKVVPRSEIGALVTDDALVNLGAEKPAGSVYQAADVNFILTYGIAKKNTVKVGKDYSQQNNPRDMYRGEVEISISLINKGSNEKAFVKNVSATSSTSVTGLPSESSANAMFKDAIALAVKNFVGQFAIDYAPPAIVQQTKGGGKAAMLNIGENYGVGRGMKVEFFIYKEKDGKRQTIPFACGKVIDLDKEACWVEVENFEVAGVMENHFARLKKDQSKRPFEDFGL